MRTLPRLVISRSLIGVALLASTTSCGSSSPGVGSDSGHPGASATTTTARLKPCSLISDAQAAAALGEPVDAGKPSDVAVINGCVWGASSSASFDLVTVNVDDMSSFANAKVQAAQGGFTLEPLAGVGDDAFYETTGPLTVLRVKVATATFSVDVEKGPASNDSSTGSSSDKAAERQLGALAVANISSGNVK